MAKSYTPGVKKILKAKGCTFVRHGKGDHDWWQSPITNKRFTVDNAIKSWHLANTVLKKAGLDKAF